MLKYYVDPGSGFIFTQGPSFLWGALLGFAGAIVLFWRMFFRYIKKFFRILLVLLLIAAFAGALMNKPKHSGKVVIIGIDAMDPNITQKLIAAGRLPNFKRLMDEGSYGKLATTVPSETAVVWSSFSTGMDPGGHGIFDFVMRNPSDYSLYLSLNEISNSPGKTQVKSRRKGDNFWNILSLHKVPSFIYFCPNTFPPDKLSGKMLSGMGVPDITGTMGRSSFYTSDPDIAADTYSRVELIKVGIDHNMAASYLYGPMFEQGDTRKRADIPFKILLGPDKDTAEIKISGKSVYLKKEQWSGWQKVSFKIGGFKAARGMVKFYLKSVSPVLRLYASPVNFDPEDPLFAVSYPKNYSGEIAREAGPYYTQGMPHDTWILTEGFFSEKDFLSQVDQVFGEQKRILEKELGKFKQGAFFFYFETLDVVQHMFWRYIDPKNPLYEQDPLYSQTIFKYYEKMDGVIGQVLKSLDKDSTLIVLSDHGFSDFRKAVHLNRWLLENGYLALKEGRDESNGLDGIDWSKTKAYSIGFGGIYLNMRGREAQGIVSEAEAGALKQEISAKLKQFRDPRTDEAVVSEVYESSAIYAGGQCVKDAPELYAGFNAGFRASWQTALGGTPALLMEANTKKWSGDHLIDPAIVPGVIFLNKKTDLRKASILDAAPTILALFGIDKPDQMTGKALLKNDR